MWLLLSAAIPSFAYDFQSGNLCYNITGAGTVEVTRDSINDYEGLTNVVIPGTVTHNGKTYSVTSIGDLALSGCLTLTSVTISDDIVSIGEWAFGECPNLISVTIPNSVTTIGGSAFSGAMITSLTLPNNLTTIGEAAFMFCLGLTSVDIPSSVTYIGEEAFTGCLNIMSLTVPTGVTNIGEDAFQLVSNVIYSGTATGAPWGARSMNGYVEGTFVYADATKTSLLACNRMAKGAITIPNSVTSIGNNAFYYCDSITSITIPNSVTSIGEWVFRECYSLTSITIPNDVTSIKRGTFDYCAGLTSVTIPNSVTSIGAYAFRGCTGLTSITILDGVTTIGTYAFFSCTSLTSVSIPNSVTTIEGYAFHNTPWFDNLPDGVVYINRVLYAYKGTMPQRTSIVVKEGTTCISGSAFYGCHSLTSITIPNSVMTIGWAAFYDCTGLESVTCQAMEPPFAFLPFSSVGISSIPLYVPVESIDKYAAADVWKDFMEIKAISATSVEADEPILTPEENKVTITWPTTDDATTYTIEISKEGTLIYALTFNANGALQSMRSAAPSRYATQHTTQAEATSNGFCFVVEGLDYATTYTYSITVTDKDETVLTTYSGTFTTKTPTGIEDLLSAPSQPTTRKVFRDGQVYILRGGKTYNINGTEVK